MVKEPRPGRVKTRLGRDIGHIPAAWWFRHQVRKLLRRLGSSPKWQTILAVTPDRPGLESRVWPGHIRRMPQGTGDLGDRMARVFRTALPGPVVIIGADIPGITQRDIDQAFQALGRADAVFGPAPDGGYWLIGLARHGAPVPAGLFRGTRWSTEHALSDTIASLPKHTRIARIATLADVDTGADLQP
ncbi:MAG: TIGR04282 family arsenosugar biosynthesis glycosyltransferase [Pseudomonadota bacterium]